MRSYDHKHPKGTKYTPSELKRHRDSWYAKVKQSPGVNCAEEMVRLDQVVFARFVALLPYSGVIRLLEEHNFADPFPQSVFPAIDAVESASKDPSMEFLDPDLEGMRATLVRQLVQFRDYLAAHTWATPFGRQSVASEWEVQQPKLFAETVSRLNAMSSEASLSYKDLFREARKRLGVDPSAA
jgi:hypothetical protein